MGMIFDDERQARIYNEAREKCLLRVSDECGLSGGVRKCLPNEYTKCPLFEFLRAIKVRAYG